MNLQEIEIRPFSTSSLHETFLMEVSGRFFEIGKDVAELLTYFKCNGCEEASIEEYSKQNGTFSYNRFVAVMPRCFVALTMFLKLVCFGECSGISFVDSTCIPVIHNKRQFNMKVFQWKCEHLYHLAAGEECQFLRKIKYVKKRGDDLFL